MSKKSINLTSFSPAFGIPSDAQLVFSVRHLSSADIKQLRRYDGRHKGIQEQLLSREEYQSTIEMIVEQVKNFLCDQKTNAITVAVGCERGRHRSVAVIERLAEIFEDGYDIEIVHRDLERTRYEKSKQRERNLNRDRKYGLVDDDD